MQNLDYMLVAAFVRGSQAAFRRIFKMSAPHVYWLAVRICGNREAAEDIVQETFLILHRKRRRIRPDQNLAGYLLRTASRLAVRWQRQNRREVTLETHGPSRIAELTQQPADAAPLWRVSLQQAMDRLPASYRAVLALRLVHDLSYAEISDALDISVSAVGQRIRRARRALRAFLQENDA